MARDPLDVPANWELRLRSDEPNGWLQGDAQDALHEVDRLRAHRVFAFLLGVIAGATVVAAARR